MRHLIFALLALFALTGCEDAMKMADDIIVDTEPEAPSTSMIDDKEYVEVWLRDPSRDVTLQIPDELNYHQGWTSNTPDEGLTFSGFTFYEDRIFAPDLNDHENHEFDIHTGAYLGSFSTGGGQFFNARPDRHGLDNLSLGGGYIAKNPTGPTLMWQRVSYRIKGGHHRVGFLVWDIDARKVVSTGPVFDGVERDGAPYVINDIFYLYRPVGDTQRETTKTFTAYEPFTDFTQFPLPAYDFTTEPTHIVIDNLDTTHPNIETYGRDPNHWDIAFHTEDALYMFNAYLTSDGVRTIHGDYERTWHSGLHKWDVPSGRYVGEVSTPEPETYSAGKWSYTVEIGGKYNRWNETVYHILIVDNESTAIEKTTVAHTTITTPEGSTTGYQAHKHAWHKRDVKLFAYTKQ